MRLPVPTSQSQRDRAGATDTPPLTHQLLVPSLVSLIVHGALLAIIATVTWTIVTTSQPDPLGGSVIIDFDNPASEPLAPDEPAPDNQSPTSIATRTRPPAPESLAGLAHRTPPATPALPTLTHRPGATTSPVLSPGARPRRGVAFAGVRADRAASVVYVIDASGAMASSLPFAIEELGRSISRLDPSQRFQVVVFRDRSAVDDSATAPAEAFAPDNRWTGLLTASPVNKAAARQWLNRLFPSGRSRPLAGIEMALRLRPDVVFVLTRSIQRTQRNTWGAGEATILDRLDRLNPIDRRTGRRPTLIKTIQLIDDDPTGILQAIGRIHGGGDGYALRSLDQLGQLADAPDPMLVIDPRLDAAAALLASLARDAIDLRVLSAIPSRTDRARALKDATRAATLLQDLPTTDDYTMLLLARANLIAHAGGGDNRLLDRVSELLAMSDPHEPALRWVHALLASTHATRAAQLDATVSRRLPPLGDPPRGIDPALVFEARLALIHAIELDRVEAELDALLDDLAHPPHAVAGRIDPLLAQLAIDTASRRLLRAARTPTGLNTPLLQRMVAAQLLWLDLEETDLSPRDRRSLAMDRLASQVPPGVPLADLPPLATLALALDFAARPQGRRDALELLRELSARNDAGPLAIEALDTMASLLATSPAILDRLAGVVILEELASDHPDTPLGTDAQIRALALARQIEQETGDDPKYRGVLMTYVRTLGDALPHADLPHRDFWLAEHDRVCLALARAHSSVASLHLLEKIRPGAPEARDAIALYSPSLTPELTNLINAYAHLRDDPAQPDRARIVLSTALALLDNAEGFYEAHRQRRLVHTTRATRADLFLLARDSRAEAIFRALIFDRARVPAGSFHLALGLAESLILQGRDQSAAARLRRIVAGLPTPVPDHPDDFWRAWTLLLETTARHNDGTRDGELRARLAWLTDLDPALGSQPWRDRLETIARGLQ